MSLYDQLISSKLTQKLGVSNRFFFRQREKVFENYKCLEL